MRLATSTTETLTDLTTDLVMANNKNRHKNKYAPYTYIYRRTLAQLRTIKSHYLKSYLHKVDAQTHPSPLCPLCNIHTHDPHHLFNCTHIRTPGFVDRPAGVTALLAGGPQAGTSYSPPLVRVMGVGRQHAVLFLIFIIINKYHIFIKTLIVILHTT